MNSESILVFGAARSGVAAANFLAAAGSPVTLTDSKSESDLPLAAKLDPRVLRAFGGHPDSLLDGTTMIVVSPGIPTTIPLLKKATERGIPLVSEIELAFRHLKGRVIAITGTNGKSTTTSLIGEILAQAGREPIVAGNIGEPLISSIDPTRERDYVIELSSFQLETIESFRANVALLLNVTPDHLDRYASMDEYAAAKYKVFNRQTADDFAIVNANDERTVNPPTAATVFRFSGNSEVERGAWFDGTHLICNIGGADVTIPRSDLRIEGSANVENALAGWLTARALGIGNDVVRDAFRSFPGLPHRMVMVRELGGVRYINDSKGTNVDAAIKSLEAMPDGRVVLILGGKDKAGEFDKLRPLLEKKVRTVLTIGSAAEKITKQISGAAPIVEARDMSGAIRWASQNAKDGEVVLLSPACASFDQYNNFEERGDHFERLVNELSEVTR